MNFQSTFRELILQIILVLVVTYLSYLILCDWLNKKWKRLPPGPIGLPLVGYLPFLGLEPHKTFVNLSKKYGNIIGVQLGSKYTVVLNEYHVMKEVLSNTAALDRAPNLFEHIPRVGFISANGEEWQEQRRFCLHATRDLGLGKGPWDSLVQEEVSSFLEELKSHKGKAVDISHMLSCAIGNNIMSLLIGRRLQKEVEEEKRNLLVNFSDVAFTYMGPSNPTSLIPGLRKYFETFKIAGYDKAAKIISNFSNFMRDEIKGHQQLGEFQDMADFVNLYLDKLGKKISGKPNHYFSDKNLEGNVNILFLGASDTIFSSLGWLFRLMAAHQDVQEKVQQELDEVIGRHGSVTYDERHKVPYTFAVIMESQRFSSIVPLSTTRRANADFTVSGYTIPKGAEITGNLWAIHNDPSYWTEPDKFLPERFLTEDKKRLLKTPLSYAPFSIGRRNCPGETVAWMEILVFFTSVLQSFKISASPGTKPSFKIVNGLVAHLEPQPLCFTERNE